jgi:uncharacterized RmlC-like cupin family protein
MIHRLFPAVVAAFAIAAGGATPVTAPEPILPGSLHYVSPPGLPGVEAALILGDPGKAAPYLQRVKLAAGAKVPPHTHPDERNTTVLSGTIYVGFGETFDPSRVVAVPTGAVYVAPAGIPHYVWAKDGAAVYQEAGMGPTDVTMVASPKR